MSELNFPKNPAVGQEYTFNSLLYMFDGVKWVTKGTGYNPVQDLYEVLASDAGASFVGANGYDNVQAALDANADFVSRFDREALRRSYAEAGYALVVGSFEQGGTVATGTDVLLYEAEGKAYSWNGVLPKVVPPSSTPASTGGVGAGAWVDRSDVTLHSELAASGGAGLVGGVDKPVTSSEFAGGADPTGAAPSDAAFSAAGAYEGGVRVEGNFLLNNTVTRTKSVMELPPGSTITKNKLAGPSTANGANILSKTMFGRLIIRDEDMPSLSGTDSFATWPDMGQALRLDSKQVRGQCGMFLGGDRKLPVIGGSAYVGLHTRHDQSIGTPNIWGFNPVAVKNLTLAEAPDNLTIGAEISVSNNRGEVGLPQRTDALEGLFISYIHTQNNASAALSTGGLSAGFNNGLWIDGVKPAGVHIQLRDEVSANAGARRGLDTSGTSAFTEGAVVLGRGHTVNSINTSSGIATLLYINATNEVVHGHSSNIAAHRFIGPATIFDHTIRPGSDNVYDYGNPSSRGRTAYFGTGTINTSDERHKQGITAVNDALLDAWAEVDWYTFKFIDAVEAKGEDGARWHFGLVAQRVKAIFDSHGIDGFKLGLLCYDKWDDQYEQYQVNEGETVIKTKTVTPKESVTGESNPEPVTLEYECPAEPVYGQRLVRSAGELYGIRYEEALSLEAAYQRRNYQRLLSRIEALEVK